jgi:hypothetical protein
MKTGLRRYIKFAFPILIAGSGYLGYEALLLRMEAAAFQSGRYDEAARLIGPVALMRRSLNEQLRAQLAELDAKNAPAPLALLAKLHDLAPDPAIAGRLATARLLAAPIEALTLGELEFTHAPTPAPPEPPFRAVPIPGKQTPWGALCRLALRAPDGAWEDFGEGFAGPLGASYALSGDQRSVLVADDAGIERWDLGTGKMETLKTIGAPQFVAERPRSRELAYTVAGEAGDALYLLAEGESRRLYPLEGQPPLPWLGFGWAPDGRSLWVSWEDEAAGGADAATHMVWLSAAGEVLLEATLDAPVDELAPRWLPSPDGRRMVLTAAGGAWLWTDGTPKGPRKGPEGPEPLRVPLPAPVALDDGGDWLGWSPDGSKLAALDGSTLRVVDAAEPARQTARTYPEWPAAFMAGTFTWRGDRLSLVGRAADRADADRHGEADADRHGEADGPYRDVTITVPLALSAASASREDR